MSTTFALFALLLTLTFSNAWCKSNAADSSSSSNSNSDSEESDSADVAQQNPEALGRFQLSHNAQWPSRTVKLGQISGVAFTNAGNAVVFHRGSRKWTADSFDNNDVYKKQADGKVKQNTLVEIDASGKQIYSWGADLFYMPHGLTIDSENNVWVTDVAAHQVFKFTPDNKKQPALVLGEALKPGSDATHFCKPTDIAVARNGDFFVADGYCNSRVLKFDRSGKLLAQFGDAQTTDSAATFDTPHSLALMEDEDTLCVADRENERVQCFDAGLTNASRLGELKGMLMYEEVGPVYAIAYDQQDALLHGVCLGATQRDSAFGFSVSLSDPELPIIGTWAPRRGFLMPHDIAVSPDGKNILVGDVKSNRVHLFTKIY